MSTGPAADSLRRAVHAHVWTGGADAWVWAVPMDGSGPGLGLTLTDGELWAYSVESRDQFTGSNLRGHLYLHLTDHARCARTPWAGSPSCDYRPPPGTGWPGSSTGIRIAARLPRRRTPAVQAARLAAGPASR